MENDTPKTKPPLKLLNGKVCVQTKQGWIDILGKNVMILRYVDSKPRFFWGRIKHVVENRIQITIPSFRPGQEDKFVNTTLDDPAWTFSNQENLVPVSSPSTIPLNVGTRCDRARPAIHPQTGLTVLLQCVMKGSHSTCHFENPPGNK